MRADFPAGPEHPDPSLDGLVRALTADGSADELAGRQAALAMFRRSRRRPRRRFAFPMSTAAAAVVIVGAITAAYAAVLPAPVQHVAFRMLNGIGVPDAHHPPPSAGAPPGTTSLPTTTSNSARPATPKVRVSATVACPCRTGTQGTSAPQTLVLTAAYARIPADGDDVLSGRLARGGRAEPGVRVRLLERVAGRPAWTVAGSAVTDGQGDVILTVMNLTSNASFRLAAKGRQVSLPVRITVIPPVSLRLAPGGRPGVDTLTATASFADTGDVVVLQKLSAGSWISVGQRTLDLAHLATFTVRIPESGYREYRVVIKPTGSHGSSVSGRVRVAAPVSASPGKTGAS